MSPFASVQCPILVGRDDVLDLIDRRLAEVGQGHGRTLLLGGEPGIGKSRLIGVIHRAAKEAGLLRVQADNGPQDHDVPLALLQDLFRTMRFEPAYAELGEELLARCAAATTAAGATYSRTLVLELVDRLRTAIRRPTVLVFEDLQWADDLTLEAIGELARRAPGLPLLVVAAYRLDESRPGTPLRDWRARLLTQRLAEEIRLGRLDLAGTATMTTLLLGTGLPASREVVDEVYRRSDGVPLHVEELIAAVRAAGPVDAATIRDAAVPDSIEDVVLSRLARRSADAQAVARAGAVIGRCFVPDVLAGVLDRPVEELEAPLRELVEHAVLHPIGTIDDGWFDFRHQLIRDALYRDTPDGDRRRFHARAAEFGASLVGATNAHASLHFERAGRREDAYRTALAGAAEASRLAAHREAYALYQRAVDNQPAGLSDLERGELLERLSDEAGAIERNDVAERAVLDAAEAYGAAGDEARRLTILGALLTLWRRNGGPLADRQALIAEVRAGLEALPPSEMRDLGLRFTVVDQLIFEVDSMDLAAARVTGRDAAAMARAADDEGTELAVAARLAMVEILAGDPDGGLAALTRVALDARAAGHQETSVTAFRDVAVHALRVLDYGEAQRALDEGLVYADSVQQSHCAHVMAALQAELDWAAGRWDAAMIVGQQAVVDPGCSRAPAMARWSLGAVLAGRGEVDRARAVLADALAFGDRSEVAEWRLPPRWALAETALIAGDPAEAVRWCEEALAIARASGDRAGLVPLIVPGVRAYLGDGRPEGAARWLAACDAHLATTPAFGSVALHHGRGLVALAAGSTGAARTELEAAVAGWDACGRVWDATQARLDLAGCLLRTNRFAAGVAVAVQARAVAEALPSPNLLDRADELIRHGKGRIVEDDPWRPLTAREFAVARLIAEGRTNAEIADELGIAPKTASSHVEHILAKLGAARRAEIAAWASSISRSLEPREPR